MLKKILKHAVTAQLFLLSAAVAVTAGEIAVIINVSEDRAAGPHSEMLEGFSNRLAEEGVEYKKSVFNLAGDLSGEEILSRIKGSSPEAVIPLGSSAAEFARENITGLPVIFSMLSNPVGRGLVDNISGTGTNFTGVTLDIPPAKQLEMVMEAMPGIEKVGVIYDPANSEKVVNEAETELKKSGLVLIRKTVTEAREISGALDAIRDEGADILWAIPDGTVYSGASVRQVLLYSLRNNLPVAGFSEHFVRAGAVMGIYPDYTGIGRQTADLALRVIGGEDPGEIPIAFPESVSMAFNQRVIAAIGKNVEQSSLQQAREIFQ